MTVEINRLRNYAQSYAIEMFGYIPHKWESEYQDFIDTVNSQLTVLVETTNNSKLIAFHKSMRGKNARKIRVGRFNSHKQFMKQF